MSVPSRPSVPWPLSWEATGIQPKPIFPPVCFPGLEMLFSPKKKKKRKRKKGKIWHGPTFHQSRFFNQKNNRQQEVLERTGCLCRENRWRGVFKMGFFQHFLRRRRRKKKKNQPNQQYFWTSFALYSRRKRSPTYTPSTIYISSFGISPYRARGASHGNPTCPPPRAATPDMPQCSGKPPTAGNPPPQSRDPTTGGTHWDVGDQPVPPETVPGVGSAGSIGVHQHQHVLLALQKRRGERYGHGGPCTGGT